MEVSNVRPDAPVTRGPSRVGMIGLGRMGAAIASRLIDRGHPLLLHDVRAEAMVPLVARGACAVGSAAEAMDVDVLITMVPDDRAVAAVWLDSDLVRRLPSATVHVCMASISYEMGNTLAEVHAQATRRYVAAPLFGRPFLAERGELDVIAAGDADAIASCRPVLDSIGRRVFEVGSIPAHANLVKIARNFLVANVIESLGEAFGLCAKGGLDKARFLEVLLDTSLAAPAYRYYGEYCVARSRETLLPMRLGLKDVELAVVAAEALDAHLPTAALIAEQMRAAISEGWGDRDWAALAEWVGERSARSSDHAAVPKHPLPIGARDPFR
ncbi:MAG: NAD(P)-dependent oxidoreductase [Proteobacteria bacterium]|nr:NAD(P)-dependent oxidoreductase [Burkholderiales bacterium]